MPDRRYRALLIGNAVFRRDPQGLPKLQGPRADVDALFEALSDNESGLFAAEDIEALIDRNLQNLREELHRFFIEDATRDDVLFLYYSGHGKLDLLGRLHLCASDTRVNALPVTALRYKEDIDALIEASPAPATVTILDCCHSGAFRGGELKVKANGKGRCVITSASANELALDALGPGGTSPFTNALVTGLRFASAEHHLTAQSLYDYVETELSPAGNASPQFYFDGEGAIALAKRLPRQELAAPAAAAANMLPAIALPGTIGEPAPAAAPEPEPAGLTLPQPRTLLWELLNEAAESALSGDGDEETGELLAEVIEAAVPLDVRWPMAVLKRSGEGPGRQVIVEALARGLVKKDISEALQFARGFAVSTPERTGAHLAITAALPESEQELAQSVLAEAVDSGLLGRGERAAQMIVRLLAIRTFIEGPEPSQSDAGLARAAKRLTEAEPDIWESLAVVLRSSLEQEQDPAVRMPIQADAALRYAVFDARAARQYFFFDGHLLHETAFKRLAIPVITRGAAAILAIDASTGHRLLEIAERRCRSQADWIEFFDTLIELLRVSPGPDQANASHLISMVERAGDHVRDNEWWLVPVAAEALVASAPTVIGRLLQLDPDEDRMRRNLIRAAKQCAPVDVTAARDMATAAERLVLSIFDESEQSRQLVNLAEAFAAIDPDHAIRLLASMPATDQHLPWAITSVAAVFTATFPERIDTLIDTLDASDAPENWLTHVYAGVARVDPDWAMRDVAPLPDSPYRNSVIATAAETLASIAPGRATELASDIGEQTSRSMALLAIVRIVVRSNPEQAAAIACRIPDNKRSDYARIAALCNVSRALFAQDPTHAEKLLALAEHTADSMDDSRLKGSLLCDIANAYIKVGSASLRASNLLTRAQACAAMESDDGAIGRTRLLVEIMIGWATIAPKRAERIVEGLLPDQWRDRDSDLGEGAIAMAPSDPRRAEQFASKISEKWELLRTQSALVEEFCKSAPARAEQLALSMEPGRYRARALLAVAEAEVRRQSW